MTPRIVIAQLQNKLDQLQPRERALILGGVVFLLLVFVGLVLVAPAVKTLYQAPAQQLARVEKASQVLRAASELESLRASRSQVQVREEDLQQRLQELLQAQGIDQQARVVRTEEGDLQVVLNKAFASGVLAWLAKTESISSLHLVQAQLHKDEAGLLSGEFSWVTRPSPGKAR